MLGVAKGSEATDWPAMPLELGRLFIRSVEPEACEGSAATSLIWSLDPRPTVSNPNILCPNAENENGLYRLVSWLAFGIGRQLKGCWDAFVPGVYGAPPGVRMLPMPRPRSFRPAAESP